MGERENQKSENLYLHKVYAKFKHCDSIGDRDRAKNGKIENMNISPENCLSFFLLLHSTQFGFEERAKYSCSFDLMLTHLKKYESLFIH